MSGRMKRWFGKTVEAEISSTKLRTLPGDRHLSFRITDSMRDQFLNAYMRNPYVNACVDLISTSAASIRPILKDRASKELDSAHPLAQLIKRPNPKQTYISFIKYAHACFAMNGNCYIYKVRGRATGQILYLWCISPNDVRIIRKGPIMDLFNPIDYYEIGANRIRVEVKDMIHIKNFNPLDPAVGISPLQVLNSAIEQQILIDIRNSTILKNEGKPRVLYKFNPDMDVSSDYFDAVVEEMASVWGPNKAGGTILMEHGDTIEEIFTKAVDIDFYVGSKLSMRQICAVYHMPPEKMGDGENKTYANSTEANKQYAQDCILPRVQLFFEELYIALYEEYDDVGVITYDTEDIKDLKGIETEVLKAINSAYFLTPNEKRDKLGYERYEGEGGDEIIMVGGMITLSDIVAGVQSSPSGDIQRQSKQKDNSSDNSNNQDGNNQNNGGD